MKQNALANKIAQKTFNSAKFQASWVIHMNAFGPILEPAFKDNYPARIQLTAALNKISRRELKDGMSELKKLEDACVCDSDKAAWFFFMGICFEMAGMKEHITYYLTAGKYGHTFYLPYLKIAKSAHNDAEFAVAEENYRAAIDCLDAETENEQQRVVLASAYTNLASCLTMMHRFPDAKEALETSVNIHPSLPGRAATKAILYAAMGDSETTAEILAAIEEEMPQTLSQTAEMTDKILNGIHPHFHKVPIEEQKITEFWHWFVQNEKTMLEKLDAEEYDDVFTLLQTNIAPVFPFLQRNPELGIQKEQHGTEITLADFYMVSLEDGYRQLIDARPAELTPRWKFVITH